MGLSLWHLLVVLLVVVIVFGVGKLPQVMGDLGKGIRKFREGMDGKESGPPKQLTGPDSDSPPKNKE